MMILCSIDLFYYSLIGLALYHFIGNLPSLSPILRKQGGHFRSMVFRILNRRLFRCCFSLGNGDSRNVSPPRYANIHGNNSSNRSLFNNWDQSFSFQLLLFLFPFTFSLCSSCYYRYNQLQSSSNLAESRWDRFSRIFTVYIIFAYTIFFVLFWSFVTTASYKLAWILSPFGLTLALFSLFLYIKSKRLRREDFRLQSMTIIPADTSSVNDEQPILTGRTSTSKDHWKSILFDYPLELSECRLVWWTLLFLSL